MGAMSVVMLTGASGFLGIHILGRLLDEGHRVRALVRTSAKLRENLALLDLDLDDPRIEVVPGDMTDAAAVREAARGCDQRRSPWLCADTGTTFRRVRWRRTIAPPIGWATRYVSEPCSPSSRSWRTRSGKALTRR